MSKRSPCRTAGWRRVADRSVLRAIVTMAAVVGLASVSTPPAYAAAETEHGKQTQVDVNPDTQDPCTGAIGELVDDERDSWSVTSRSDGSYVARGHAVIHVTFTPYDAGAVSYDGHEVFSAVERVTRGADGFTSSQRVRLTSSSGGVLVFVQTAHMTVTPDGRVVVDQQSSSLTCG